MKGQAISLIILTNLEDRHQGGQGAQVDYHLRSNPRSSTRSIQSSRDQRSYE